MFTVRGRDILKDGGPFVMRGYNLGNWLMLERFMFGFPGVDQVFRRHFRFYGGEEKYNWFFDRYYKTYFQEKDAEFLQKMGCNTIRIPFNYRVFESDERPFHYNEKIFEYMDFVVETCAKHGIYSVIDYHAVQGYENAFHCSDNITGVMQLYHSKECRNRCVKLWEYVADHYKDNENVIGYDLINEPGPGDSEINSLKELYRELVKAVRAIDGRHILFLEGPALSNQFDCMDEVFDGNMAFSPHYYHSGPKFEGLAKEKWRSVIEQDVTERSRMSEQLGIPCWFGEMGISAGRYGAVRLECMDITLDILNQRGISWTLWTYKDLYRMGLFSTAENCPWREQTRRFIRLKEKYRLDDSNVGDWEITDPLFRQFDEDFAEYGKIRDYSVDGDRLGRLKHRVWNGLINSVSEVMAEEYAQAFAEKSYDCLDQMIGSFDLDRCVLKQDWYDVFYRRMNQ